MQLVYEATGEPVKVGDKVKDFRGDECEVVYFKEPHKSSSVGKICVKYEGESTTRELYVTVIGAKWINREDREG